MRNYKKWVPVVALILLAFGVNLEKFGIDLEALSGLRAGQTQTQGVNNSPQDYRPSNPAAKAQTNTGTTSLPRWSKTRPEINLWHVFEGDINSQGKPTGFHARPGGRDPANARVVSVKDGPNRLGVYTANIEVRDGQQWKSKFSSFFPDNLSHQEVIDLIVHAYRNSKNPQEQPWSGPSGLGFQVQGYTSSRGGINSAFPVYSMTGPSAGGRETYER